VTTEVLVKKCIRNDASAWQEFVKCYEKLVCWAVRRKFNSIGMRASRHEVCDIAQEIFIEIWEKNRLSMLRNTACLKAWLCRIASNRTINYCRKTFKEKDRTTSLDSELTHENSGFNLGSVIPCNKFNGLKSAEAQEIGELLEQVMSRLGRKNRTALRLQVFESKKQREIAGIMNMPVNTVSTLVRRGKMQVCESINRFYNERK